MNWLHRFLDKILLPKSTLELQELNGLWERFNQGENVLEEVAKHPWKYHKQKAQMLIDIHALRR